MCAKSQRGLVVSFKQWGCHQRSSLLRFCPSCFSARSPHGEKDSVGALICSRRGAVGECPGSRVGTRSHARTFNTHTNTRCSNNKPLQVGLWLQLTVHGTHSPAELDHWWGQFHLKRLELEDESDLKPVQGRALITESQGSCFTFQNECWLLLWVDLIRMKWLVWLRLHVTGRSGQNNKWPTL